MGDNEDTHHLRAELEHVKKEMDKGEVYYPMF
jgi:hypothetical protein